MPDMSQTSTLQPLIPPPTPDDIKSEGDVAIALGIGITLGFVFLSMLIVRCHKRWRTRRRLKMIQRLVDSRQIEPAIGAYNIAYCLQWYFGLNRLEAFKPPKGVNSDEWMRCIKQLDVLRYTPQPATEVEILRPLFTIFQAWLRC